MYISIHIYIYIYILYICVHMFSLLLATHLSYGCLYTSVGFVAKLADVNER